MDPLTLLFFKGKIEKLIKKETNLKNNKLTKNYNFQKNQDFSRAIVHGNKSFLEYKSVF